MIDYAEIRHAWLIIAHNEFEVLQRLVSMLDSSESDFYIHFDKKIQKIPQVTVKQGRITILEHRIDVRWGTASQIKVELLLLQTALVNGPYEYYHILSGTHLPLVPVSQLISFYEAHHGKEIVRFWPDDLGEADFKLRRYHFPVRNFKSENPIRRRLCQLTWRAVIKVQKMLGIRHHKNAVFYKTDNWLSLTEKACRYLVENRYPILKKYKFSFCGDEYFVASELMAKSSEFVLQDCPNLLFVEFQNDTPTSYSLDKYPELKMTRFLWARKFTASNVSRLD